MLKSDFHTHTNYIVKGDSNIPPKQLIDLAVKYNYEVIALTEHTSQTFLHKIKWYKNVLRTYNYIKDYAKKKGILLIPGIETHVEGKETLLLNFNQEYKEFTFDDLYKLKEENIVIVAPHPFYGRRKCLGNNIIKHRKLFDAIEISHFYYNLFNPNKKAIKIAKKYKKTLLANSDAHRPYHMNLNFSLLDCDKNKDSVLEAIRKNKVKIETKPEPLNLFMKDLHWVFTTAIKENTKELIKDIFSKSP